MRKTTYAGAPSWIDWTNLTLGIFLLVSPWLALGGSAAITWNAVIGGACVASSAAIALAKPSPGAEKTNVCLGLWLLIAPWALGFSGNVGATCASVLVGLCVACLAGIQLSMLKKRPVGA
jgi:hypothetical protein